MDLRPPELRLRFLPLLLLEYCCREAVEFLRCLRTGLAVSTPPSALPSWLAEALATVTVGWLLCPPESGGEG